MKKLIALCAILLLSSPAIQAQAPPVRSVSEAMSGKRLDRPTQRAQIVQEVGKMLADRRALGQKRARALRMPLRTVRSDGTITEVVDLDDKSLQPVYFTTHNTSAAISTGAYQMRQMSGLSGAGVVVGVWDGGVGRTTHQEFTSARLVSKDNGSLSDHATHVAGTIIASGIQSAAMGMAPSGTVDSYDWSSDTAEMISRAASVANEPGKIKISNHSYGFIRGWHWNGERYSWNGFSGNTASSIETTFGLYGSRSRSIDSIAYNAPYYLMFFSAGNDRSNNPARGSTVLVSGVLTSYSSSLHPPGDGVYRAGYDTLADSAVSKNTLIIGAVNDAVTSGIRDLTKASLTSFTSWGPTDDGRIKPDLVANGASVYSPVNFSDTSYGTYSGTSMASPNAAGTAALLIEHYSNLFPGQAMRSSTLKGLLIHTADDLGRPGPDYQYGWGLVNGEGALAFLSAHAASPEKQKVKEDVLEGAGGTRVHQFRWDGISPIRATICWTDPPGAATSSSDNRSRNLVNDLNLRLIAPTGAEFFPFVMPFVGSWTQSSLSEVATTGINSTDNVEQIYLPSPSTPGVYQLVVSHTGTLSGGSQHYSVFVSGSASFNTPPSATGLTDVSVDEDETPIVINFEIADAETPASQLDVVASSDNDDLIKSLVLGGEASTRSLSLELFPDANGTATIEISLSDGEAATSSSFVLTVNPVNDSPTIEMIADLRWDPSAGPISVPLIISDIDDPLPSLVVTATSQNEALLPTERIKVEGISDKMLIISPLSNRYGTSVIAVAVTDGKLEAKTSFSLLIENPHPSFEDWIASYLGDSNAGFMDDFDGDGIPNAMEYFHGLDPTSIRNPISVIRTMAGSNIIFEYRRSLQLNGLVGRVEWSSSMFGSSDWSVSGVVDSQVYQGQTHEWRRAVIPWPSNQNSVFVRIGLIRTDEAPASVPPNLPNH